MGSFTSKSLDGKVLPSASEGTPKQSKILPFDPRSPSTNVNRTPIAVTNAGTPGGAETPKTIKPLDVDPRSPSIEVTRTPLLVEEAVPRNRKHHPLKPSKLVAPEAIDENDPRSPTNKVPRTPVQEDPTGAFSSLNETPPTGGASLNKKLFADSASEKKPLLVQTSGPRDQMKALQCRNVEEEFSKNEKSILNQLQSEVAPSKTQFVQDI